MSDRRGQIIINDGYIGFSFTYTNCLKNSRNECICQECEFNCYCILMLESDIICSNCGVGLERDYNIIIKSLRENNLLPNDFEPLCCNCYYKTKYSHSIF